MLHDSGNNHAMGDNRQVIISIIDYSPYLYDELASWWAKREQEAPSRVVLGSGEGFVFTLNGSPVAAAWIYRCRKIAFLEWMMTRPGISVADARMACGRLETHVKQACQADGVRQLLGWVSTRVMAEEAVKHGYRVTDQPMYPIMKEVA